MTPSPLRRVAFAMPVVALVATVTATSGAAAKPSPTYYGMGGSGYGTTARIGTTVNSGATAWASRCSTKPGTTTNHVAAVDLGKVGKVGAVTTRLQTRTGSTTSSTSTSTTNGLNLLNGLIKADAVVSTATVSHDKSGYHRTGSSKLVGLTIAGVPIDASVPKNTTVQLPANLGKVILNAQSSSAKYGTYQSFTQAINVYLNASELLGLGRGQVVVGSSRAELHAPVHARPYGNAYGSQVNLASGLVTSGQTALVNLTCAGSTGGKVRSNSTAAVNVGQLVRVGAVASYAKSTDSARATTATTWSKIADVQLLNGAIKLDAVTTQANASRSGSKLTRTSSGTKLVGLTINGRPVTVSGKENQKITVPGLATVWLHRVVKSGSQVQVYGLQVQLLTDSAGGKAGSTISVGAAKAGVASR
ncbi:hypothetical protein FHX74_001039 [Friedmanniella endophytica]|uniref:Uncharacterized protein n=1 Tax=Microlunatus kandeliicorticis TaxID=1759536 RepID=A0A7W3IQM6_9ACTN|nr:choice-of-anchor P family protein [Microlunatus kandeliicorticis]MBA8793434.1 hypothetical protein [Microlunatus kandeliicorticis]